MTDRVQTCQDCNGAGESAWRFGFLVTECQTCAGTGTVGASSKREAEPLNAPGLVHARRLAQIEREQKERDAIPNREADHLADVEILPGDGSPDMMGVLPPYARVCHKPHLNDPDECEDCGYPGDPDAIPNSEADEDRGAAGTGEGAEELLEGLPAPEPRCNGLDTGCTGDPSCPVHMPHATRNREAELLERIACIVRDELGVKTDEPPLPVDYAIARKVLDAIR